MNSEKLTLTNEKMKNIGQCGIDQCRIERVIVDKCKIKDFLLYFHRILLDFFPSIYMEHTCESPKAPSYYFNKPNASFVKSIVGIVLLDILIQVYKIALCENSEL